MIIVFIILCIIMLVAVINSFRDFNTSISEVVDKLNFSRLQESMRQQISYFDRSNQELWSSLKLLEKQYAEQPWKDEEEMEIFIDQLRETEGFTDIYMLDKDGVSLIKTELPADAAERAEFTPGIRSSQAVSLMNLPCFGEQSVFVYSVPMTKDGAISGEIFGIYPSEPVFSALLSEAFTQQCVTGIVTKNGTVLMMEDSRGLKDTSLNLMEILENTVLDSDSVSSIVRRFERNYGGRFSGTYNGEKYYVAYNSLNQNDWMLVNMVNSKNTSETEDKIRVALLKISLVFMAVMILVVGYIIWREHSISENRKYENDVLQQVRQSYQLVTRLSDGVMFEGDYHFDTFTLNDNFYPIFGFTPQWRHLTDFLHPCENVASEDTWKFVAMGKEFMKGSDQAVSEFRVISDEGKVIWMRMDYMTIYDNHGKMKRLIGKMSNIDEQKRQMTQLTIEAEHDSLTRLFNRATMKTKTDEFLTAEGHGKRHAFFILDIDDFKNINDTCGHANGDLVLTKLADCMRLHFRESDFLARLGGDEFALLMKDVGNDAMLYSKATELRDSIYALTEECGLGVDISCSIGISIFPRDGQSFDGLYKKADIALYRAKSNGKNQFMVSS